MKSNDCIAALRALGDQKRLAMLRLVFEKRLTVNAIAERMNATQYTVSRQLKTMVEAGLLTVEQEGRFRYYSVARKLKRKKGREQVLDLDCCTFEIGKMKK